MPDDYTQGSYYETSGGGQRAHSKNRKGSVVYRHDQQSSQFSWLEERRPSKEQLVSDITIHQVTREWAVATGYANYDPARLGQVGCRRSKKRDGGIKAHVFENIEHDDEIEDSTLSEIIKVQRGRVCLNST